MAENQDTQFVVQPEKGPKSTVFNFNGTGYEDGVIAIDFGDGVSTSVTASNGGFHCSYSYAAEGDYEVTTKYINDDKEIIGSVTIKVS